MRVLASGFVPVKSPWLHPAADMNVGYPECMLPTGQGETVMVNHVRHVPRPVGHGPNLKIRGNLAKLPLSVNEITSLSAVMKQCACA